MVPLVTSASSYYLSTLFYCILLYITDPERRKYGAFGYLGLLILLINNIILALVDMFTCILQTQREGSMVPLVTLASSFCLSTTLYWHLLTCLPVYYRPREKEVWCLWLPRPPDSAYQQHYTVYYCILQTQREGSMVPLVTSAS